MAIEPVGPFSAVLAELANRIADSPTFRTWTGMHDQQEALTRVYMVDQEATDIERPYAIVGFADMKIDHRGFASGRLRFGFEAEVPAEVTTDRDACIEFMNHVGPILLELYAEAATDNLIELRETTIERGPIRSKNEESDYMQATYTVGYGIQ